MSLNETTLVVLIGMVIIFVILSHLVFLTAYPPVFIDEPWYANAAWTWLKTGVNFDAMHAGVLDQFGYAWVRRPFLGEAPWVVSFALLGLGLFQARLVSWVFGALLLLATVVVGRRSYSTATGLVAALLLSLSAPFMQASHYARQDMMLAALVMAAYALALFALEKDRWWAHSLAGLLIGLSPDIHQNGILFALGLAGLYVGGYRLAVFRKAGTWLCALGGLLGLAYYVALHILPSPSVYSTLFSFDFAGPHQVPVLGLSPLSLLAAARGEFSRYHFYENGPEFVLIGASLAYLALRRSQADRRLLIFAGLTFAGCLLLLGKKSDLYAVLLYPFFMLMVAEALVSLIRGSRGDSGQRVWAGALLALFLFNSALHYARPVYDSRDYNYYATTDKLKSVIPPGARVMGSPHWWLGLSDYDYRSILSLKFYNFYNGYSVAKALEAVRPDILIVDPVLQWMLVDDGYVPTGTEPDQYKLPRNEFDGFLAQRGEKVLEFTDPWHGTFQVYALHWDSAP